MPGPGAWVHPVRRDFSHPDACEHRPRAGVGRGFYGTKEIPTLGTAKNKIDQCCALK